MIYEEWQPGLDASQSIETFWRFAADDADDPAEFDHQIVPDGLVSIHGGFAGDRLVVALVSGPSTIAKVLPLQRGSSAAGFRLRPGTARKLLTVPLARLRDETLPLEAVAPEHASWLIDALRLARDDATRVDAGDFIDRHMPAGDPLIRAAGDRLIECWGATPIANLAGAAGLSPRHFRERFAREAGLGPKSFGLVRRQRAAWIALVAGTSHSLGDASHAAGFADQAHFNRSAREAFGRTPGEVRRYVRTIRHRFEWLNRPSEFDPRAV